MAWEKIEIQKDNGERVEALAPVIISASRSTDIPAFYSDWFFQRLDAGYSVWTNPFNAKKHYISYANTRVVVFWSKNPKPLLSHIETLKNKNINCYIQFTLNDYESEELEQDIPALEERIDTFKSLTEKLGKGRVIWRFDPLILGEHVTIDILLHKIENIANKLIGYTEKLVFSFVDINSYRKVTNNLSKNKRHYREFTKDEIITFASQLSILNKKWNYHLATCGEDIDLSLYGIEHNKCIDDDLMIRLFPHDKKLMNFLNVKITDNPLLGEYKIEKLKTKKDKGQRKSCGCIVSKDIGEYNTCPHKCAYCYANASKDTAEKNYRTHCMNRNAETITGK